MIMDYESKYKNALEWARGIYPNAVGADKEDLEHYFPELKESEDERIRKGLIKAVSGTLKGNTLYGTDVTREEALTWLEKQGEPIDNGEISDGYHTFNELMNGEKVSPAWSEKDEKNWRGVIDEIEANKSDAPGYDAETYDRFLNWLRTLKQRLA